jgi:hypothetical protein
VLVVWKLDRLSRSLHLLLILERITAAGAGFRSLTESIDTTVPAGRMMMQMLGAFAEYEREMVKERTQAGLKAARARAPWRAAAEAHPGTARGGPQPAGCRSAGGRGRQIVPSASRDNQPTQRRITSDCGGLNRHVHPTFENLAKNDPTR